MSTSVSEGGLRCLKPRHLNAFDQRRQRGTVNELERLTAGERERLERDCGINMKLVHQLPVLVDKLQLE